MLVWILAGVMAWSQARQYGRLSTRGGRGLAEGKPRGVADGTEGGAKRGLYRGSPRERRGGEGRGGRIKRDV